MLKIGKFIPLLSPPICDFFFGNLVKAEKIELNLFGKCTWTPHPCCPEEQSSLTSIVFVNV